MILVIDAGIVFIALTGKGITKELIFSPHLTLFAPEYLLAEIEEHSSRIVEYSTLEYEEVRKLLEILKTRIETIPKNEFSQFLKQANLLISDKDDNEYLALSLSKNKIPIWSNDEHFKRQLIVKVYTTKELVEKLKSEGYIEE